MKTPRTIPALMDALAKDYWCVVLKRLPPGMGLVWRNKWVCELRDMRYLAYIARSLPYRNAIDASGDTALDAVRKAYLEASMRAVEAPKEAAV